MNRLVKIALALFIPSVAVIVVMVSNSRPSQPDLRQQAVQAYAYYRGTTLTQTLLIGQYIQARLPQSFRADMSKTSFGNSTYYRTDRRYDEQADTRVWSLTMTATTVPTLTRMDYRPARPMPYPPNDLWCVQLTSLDPAAPKVILVALHQDMFNAEWIVHEVTDPEAVLAAVGCQFSLP